MARSRHVAGVGTGPGERPVGATDPQLSSLMLAVGCRPAWAVVGLLTLGGVVATATGAWPALPARVRYLPLAASLVLFGLPHGAVDHLAPARAAGCRPTRRWMAAVGALYLLLGGAYAALWWVAPVVAAALFVGVTWIHWGQGDLYALDALGVDHLDGAGVRAGTVVVRGGLPMLVPLLRYPERYRAVVDAWVGLFGREFGVTWLFAPGSRVALGGGLAVLTVVTLLAGRRATGDGRSWRRDAVETLLLWTYFLVVPPLVAVGVYFCVWHSLRHVVRLVGIDGAARAALAERGPLAALARTGRDAVPLTAVSLAGLVGIAAVAGPGSVRPLAALYLVSIAVLTLPHVVVVAWMDRAQAAGLAARG